MDETLKGLADNPMLFEAVKSYLLKKLSYDDIDTSHASNEALGQIVRAKMEGQRVINEAFDEIARMKTLPGTNYQHMPGR